MVKIHKFQGDISKEIANSFKESISIDTEATGLQIPERDKLSLIQICDRSGNVYIIQPDRKSYKAPNIVSILENVEETVKLLKEVRNKVSAQRFESLLDEDSDVGLLFCSLLDLEYSVEQSEKSN